LIQRLRNWQDEASWQEFFDTYWGLIYGVARKAGMTDVEAQDIVQETMVSVAKQMPSFRYDPAIGSFKAWLLHTTRWRIIDHARKRNTPLADEPPPGDTGTGTAAVELVIDPQSQVLDRLWEAEWEKNLFDAAIANVKRRLDPQKYQIFDFYVNREWPADKVAAQFGIPVEQVYLAKHRVTELIKIEVKRLEKEVT